MDFTQLSAREIAALVRGRKASAVEVLDGQNAHIHNVAGLPRALGGDRALPLGTDTAGSIRLPAAYCGVVGMKPTYGRVSRYGMIAFGSSLDCPGPVSRNVTDAALMLGVISGPDPRDATAATVPVPD